MTAIKGVTFPIPKEFMSRFFVDKKTVFIKPATCFKELKPGMKFLFYQSHEDTGFIGEAEISAFSLSEDPLVFIDQYGENVFLTLDELTEYLKNQQKWKRHNVEKSHQRKRFWMAIKLENIRQYPNIRKPSRFVSVGGQYLR
jgi:hypothetical protein